MCSWQKSERFPLEERVGLLAMGVKFPPEVISRFTRYRYKRASLSEGLFIEIRKGAYRSSLNVAALEPFVKHSPYSFNPAKGLLLKNGEILCNAEVIYDPSWYSFTLEDGTPIARVIQAHGRYTLTACITPSCSYILQGRGCKFCAIATSEASVTSGWEIAHAVRKVLNAGFPYRELNINSGTPRRDRKEGVEHLRRIIQEIKKEAQLPIYLQMTPPADLQMLHELKDAGVNSISFNIEIFD